MHQIQYNSKTRFHDPDNHQHYTAVRCQLLPCCASISICKTTTQEAHLSQRDCPCPMLDWPWSHSRSSEMARFDKPQAYITSCCLSVVVTLPHCAVSEILPVLTVSGCCCCRCKHATQCNKKANETHNREEFHLVGLNILIKNSSKQPKSSLLLTFRPLSQAFIRRSW